MGFRLFFARQGNVIRRILGVILAVLGVSILFGTAPPWVWYAILGIGLMGVGWFLFQLK